MVGCVEQRRSEKEGRKKERNSKETAKGGKRMRNR